MPQSTAIAVLIVDDDPAVLDSFRDTLERESGFTVTTIRTGADALNRLDTHYFDVIMADYSMPDMDGIALLREVRARGCRSLFVIITGKRLAHIAMDALNNGADYYVQKGVDTAREFGHVIEFIRKRVPQKNAEQELIEWERFYHSVVEQDPDLICRIQPDGCITYMNETGVRFFRKDYNQIIGQKFFALIPGDERSSVLSALQNLSAVKPDLLMEHRISTGDGTPQVLQWSYLGFFSPHGAVAEYQVSGRNATALVRIGEKGISKPAPLPIAVAVQEPAVQKQESYDWKGLVDTIQSLDTPVFGIDKTGTVIAWNTALEQLTGVAASSIMGKGNQQYAIPFYGKPTPMLIDAIFMAPGSPTAAQVPGIKKVGDTYIGEMEHVMIRGRPMLLWGKGSPVYDAKGTLIAALEVITVGEPQEETDVTGMEQYLGGISSITIKISGEGMGGVIAGAIGSSTGGYGVYATDRRLFIIRNPDLDTEKSQGVQFGTFIMDELFGMTVDTRPKSIRELEGLKIFEAQKKDITGITMKRPVLLSGYLNVTLGKDESFRVYIDHKKAFTHIEQLMQSFSPDKIRVE